MTDQPTTQVKYIIIGLIFWLTVLAVVITGIQFFSKIPDKSLPTQVIKLNKQWFVQVASFDNKDILLNKLEKKLKKHRYKTHIVFSVNAKGRTIKGVRVGPYQSYSQAGKVKKKIAKSLKLSPKIIVITTPNLS